VVADATRVLLFILVLLNIEMSPPTDRKSIIEKLHKSIKDGNIIVGAGAGIGLSAKFIEQGGGDMIIIYNSGRFRMAGRGSLAGLMPYGNANDVVLDMVSNSFLSSSCNIRANLQLPRQTKFFRW
jgi:predicted TIM-barrel enzyme